MGNENETDLDSQLVSQITKAGIFRPAVEGKQGPPHLRLTKRDEDIMVFLLDQKFATIEAVYLRFFDKRTSSELAPPPGFYTTRQRVLLLQKHGL